MQTKPLNWESLFQSSHAVVYKYVIDDVEYTDSDVQGTPVIKKPLMERPCIGSVNAGSLEITVRKKSNVTIPKAATVVAYCRLSSRNGNTVTPWVEQGHYLVSKRRKSGGLIILTCYDDMLKAGTKYIDKTAKTDWPATMESVVTEIAGIMGVDIDPRTVIRSGSDYVVSYPNDRLMSEVLGMIGAAHCGNWIMTEAGKLRLIPSFGSPVTASQAIGTAYRQYNPISTVQSITRVTLTDDAGINWTIGDDTGRELTAECDYATQGILDDAAVGYYVRGNTLYGVIGGAACMTATINGGSVNGGTVAVPAKIIDNAFQPYSLDGAYLDPCIELGDTVSIAYKGSTIPLIVASLTIRCNSSYNADVSYEMEDDDEDEYPYISLTDLRATRYLSTEQSYYGNRLNRNNGLTSELIENGEAISRLIANASTFSMQQLVDGSWMDRIFFDAAHGKYKITGDVDIEGRVTFEDLENEGATTINGANITTGELSANRVRSGTLESANGDLVIDLDAGTMTVSGTDVSDALDAIKNKVTLLATAQMFTKAADAESYTPVSITLTAQTDGALVSYKWYKNNTEISGATGSTLTIVPEDVNGNAVTYKAVCKDSHDTPYTDVMTIAKIADGQPGDPGVDGYNTALVYLYKRTETSPAIDWTDTLTYDFPQKMLVTVPSGWSESIPAGNDPVYVTAATAYNNTNTDDIAYSEWSAPVKFVENGESGTDGLNAAVVFLYKRSSNEPAGISNALVYTFTTGVLSGEISGWSQSIPASDGNPCWAIQATAISADSSYTIEASSWSAPNKIVENGTGGYTVLLSNEYVEVNVDKDRRPISQATYACAIRVYRGLEELTATLDNPSTDEFCVTILATPTGAMVTQNPAGQINISVSPSTAINDYGEVNLVISLNSGLMVNGIITVQANMNSLVVSHDSSIEQLQDSITLCVTEMTYHAQVPVYTSVNPAANWTTSEKAANVGYLWFNTSDTLLYRWTGSMWTLSTSANANSWSEYAQSMIKIVADGITLSVTNESSTSTLSLKSGTTELSSATIQMTGMVTFTDLQSNGNTKINGDYITTGTIAAARIDVDNLLVKHLDGATGTFNGLLESVTYTPMGIQKKVTINDAIIQFFTNGFGCGFINADTPYNDAYGVLYIGAPNLISFIVGGVQKGSIDGGGTLNIPNGVFTSGLYCMQNKNCIHETEHYGKRLYSCYETADYYLGDIGNGIVVQGICNINIDPIVQESIHTDSEYHVFLSSYGNGRVYVSERHETYFVVRGDDVPFVWEIKGIRRGFENCRLKEFVEMMPERSIA